MPIDEDTILDLAFGPDWARKSPDQGFSDFDPGRGGSRRGRGRRDGDRRGRRDGDRRGRSTRGSRDRRGSRPPMRGQRPDSPRHHAPSHRAQHPPVVRPPVTVRFLPHQNILNDLARRIRLSKQAHSLMDVARLFMANPESCDVRLEADREAKDLFFLQCKKCRWAGMDEDALIGHMVKEHLEEFFVKESIEIEAPTGAFTCVAQCGLSGILLAPPNHHSYAAKVREVHETRCPNMPLDQYQSRIRMLHDEEKIAEWKDEQTRRDVYRLKSGGEDQEPMSWAEAEESFRKDVAPKLRNRSKRTVLPLPMAKEISDRGLALVVREAFMKEDRFPGSLLAALRGAFHSKKLHIFRVGKSARFVSAIKPAPLAPDQAVDAIREVLLCLKEHPGMARQELLEKLRPEQEPDSEPAKEVLGPLDWLVDKGHLIEFSNGTLSVPRG